MVKGWKAKCIALRVQVAELEQEIKSLRGGIYQPREVAKRIIEIRQANPCASLQAIGDKVNLSRERVRQILHKAQLPTVHVRRLPPQFLCLNCGIIFTPRPPKPEVKRASYDHEAFCAKKCDTKYHLLTLTCEVCGIIFQRPQSELMSNIRQGYGNHIFCSKTCSGKWAGKTFGFVAHPENMRKGRTGGRKRHWDYEHVWAWQKKTGWGCCQLSRSLDIPESTISRILAKAKTEKVLTKGKP